MSILCLESGGTKLVAAIANDNGTLLDREIRNRNPDQDARETLQCLVEAGKGLLGNITPKAVGFGFGGTVQRSTGEPLLCFHEAGWENAGARQFLMESFHSPVFIENDCNLAALAEACVGHKILKGAVFYITVGTGIGGGIVHNGRLLKTGDYGEGEIGHVVVDSSGPTCPCGNRGCLESLCSGPGLSVLSEITIGKQLDSRQIMEGLKEGRPEELRVASAAADLFSRALGPVISILSPCAIIFGGGVMFGNSCFLDLVRTKVLEKVFPVFLRQPPRFLLSNLQESVVCQGAAIYAVQELRQLEQSGSF